MRGTKGHFIDFGGVFQIKELQKVSKAPCEVISLQIAIDCKDGKEEDGREEKEDVIDAK